MVFLQHGAAKNDLELGKQKNISENLRTEETGRLFLGDDPLISKP